MTITQALWNELARVQNNFEVADNYPGAIGGRIALYRQLSSECTLLARVTDASGMYDLHEKFDTIAAECRQLANELAAEL